MFSKLKIGKDPNFLSHVGTFPIVFINFYCSSKKLEMFHQNLKTMLKKLFGENKYLYERMIKKNKEIGESDKILKSDIEKYERFLGLEGMEPTQP